MPNRTKPHEPISALSGDDRIGGILAVGAWFAGCLGVFLWRRPIPFFTNRFPSLPSPALVTAAFLTRTAGLALCVGLFWTAAWRLGRWALKLCGTAPQTWLEEFLLTLGLGAGALGLLAFGLGLCHFLQPRLLMFILVGLAVASLPDLWRLLKDRTATKRWGAFKAEMGTRSYLPLAVLATLILYQFLVALGPTLFFDSLVYHLALPDLYLRRGAVVPTPLNTYSGIPAGIEMLYVWILPWGGHGSGCQLLHLSLGVLASLAIAAAGRRTGNLSAGLWGAAIFFSNPMVLISSGRPAIELGWSFFLALAMLASLIYLDSNDARWLAPVGILAGLTLGAKYQAVMLLPALLAVFWRSNDIKSGLHSWIKVCLIAIAVAAPWGLRNIAFYRNPVFPFLSGSIFPANEIDVPAFMSSAHSRGVGQIFGSRDGFKEFVAHPWSYSFPFEDSEADNALSFLYIALLPLVFIRTSTASTRKLLFFAAALWIPMNLLSGIARFSIPALVPLSLVIATALVALPEAAFSFAQVAVALVFVLNGTYAHSKTMAPLWRVLSGEIPESQYLSRNLPTYPTPPYATFAWANAHLPPDARVLLIGEPRSFYLERDAVTSSPYADQPIAQYANASTSADDLYQRLRSDGITYIIMNFQGMSSSRQTMKMSESGLEALRGFWAGSLTGEYVDQSVSPGDPRFSVVYRLLTPEERARPHPRMDVPFEGHASKSGA